MDPFDHDDGFHRRVVQAPIGSNADPSMFVYAGVRECVDHDRQKNVLSRASQLEQSTVVFWLYFRPKSSTRSRVKPSFVLVDFLPRSSAIPERRRSIETPSKRRRRRYQKIQFFNRCSDCRILDRELSDRIVASFDSFIPFG